MKTWIVFSFSQVHNSIACTLFICFVFQQKVKDQLKISDLQPEILRHSFIVLQIRSNILVCHPGIRELNILNLNFPPNHLYGYTSQNSFWFHVVYESQSFILWQYYNMATSHPKSLKNKIILLENKCFNFIDQCYALSKC